MLEIFSDQEEAMVRFLCILMEFLLNAVFLVFWLGLGDWNQKENASLSQVMRPSNEMFNLHDHVTAQFHYRYSCADFLFYYQDSHDVGVRNYHGKYPIYVVCEWTNETKLLVNSKAFFETSPSYDETNHVCFHNLVINDGLACKQRYICQFVSCVVIVPLTIIDLAQLLHKFFSFSFKRKSAVLQINATEITKFSHCWIKRSSSFI